MSVNNVVQTLLCLIDMDITRIKIQFEHSLDRETGGRIIISEAFLQSN